jgi:hypothetical protein
MDWKLPVSVAAAAVPLVAAGIAYNKHFKVEGIVDKTTTQHGGLLVAKVLQDHGCVVAFMPVTLAYII